MVAQPVPFRSVLALWSLRALFLVILVSMVGVTLWASLRCALFDIPREVYGHPWFIATLTDAYWGFITFYVWVAWKEQDAPSRVLWLVAVLALGNLAMAAYVLRELHGARTSADLAQVISGRHRGRPGMPAILVAASVGIYLLA